MGEEFCGAFCCSLFHGGQLAAFYSHHRGTPVQRERKRGRLTEIDYCG
jgi:hypothetical protein